MDAQPHHRYRIPGPSIWPFLTAVGFTIGLIWAVFQFSGYYPAVLLGGIGLIGWFWPRRPRESEQ
jgi:cytochrome c oxidase subunit 1